jgi:hypothetical protein
MRDISKIPIWLATAHGVHWSMWYAFKHFVFSTVSVSVGKAWEGEGVEWDWRLAHCIGTLDALAGLVTVGCRVLRVGNHTWFARRT